ncbi:ribulose-1,5-bisphosphate carboxylase/oxygenase small subunit (plastid) [Cryptomonas paramecium]|uniref:Multifunctional fusion protein n=1 Tax=Cryptomonas paramaecium TaxID=2898 RepID=D2IS65_9CRYP|nr:ribulose-1,5-bisphosphate carboxylase/oxygenase small subunit [Cryptomonas paramecium]ACT46757.1 ribulose-1,5-bisphosphate carboxylase/oxygenase small subunit [Cryptomonas paramecium]BDA98039.1 ribulose-1 5-bisphosphate carboxylase/oxygenase [Cryptomonas paramecium]|mmetsp:Transcript_62380/g.167334  ORF Transcript_62380/g.167334 Transcript_62380/m.167334 type:complete len:140 (-) Transcript_62380:2270-2689(-)
MRLTQGAFSFLPDLSEDQILKQIQYAINKGWALNVEWTDDPHPRNYYWELWGLPLFGVKDATAVMFEVNACRKVKPNNYVKLNAFDSGRGVESCCLSLIVQRPTSNEPGFTLSRTEGSARFIHYTVQSYATVKPEGERY